MAAEVLGDASSRHAADPAADDLDDDHEGQAEQHGPGEAIAELRAHLAVGGDPTRIVVCGARDQSWAETPDQARWVRHRKLHWNSDCRCLMVHVLHGHVVRPGFHLPASRIGRCVAGQRRARIGDR